MALREANAEDAKRVAEVEAANAPPLGFVDADEMLELQRRVRAMLDILEEEVGKQWQTVRLRFAIEAVEEFM